MNGLLAALLRRLIRRGTLTVIDESGTPHPFGDGTGPPIAIELHDGGVAADLLRRPELALGELYMDGRWSMAQGALTDFLVLIFQNDDRTVVTGRWRHVLRMALRRFHQHNSARAARANVHSHYDVGNDIYELFLDEDWQYSCAYFRDPGMSLEAAQHAKKQRIAAKLLLEPGQNVLDIGCGWGGMALYLADAAGVDVTGITLSDEQLARAQQRARGRKDVHFKLQDYRSVPGKFDRIVSVGMFEHVGVRDYDAYFGACQRLLSDDGVMLLHSIGRTGPPAYTAPFIQKYIFPGGYIPSLSEVMPAIERSGLIVSDVEILRLHYAQTLAEWAARLRRHKDLVVARRDERFFRLWEFYLCGSEAAFRSGDMMVFQIQLTKNLHTVPLTRTYIDTTEATLQDNERTAARGPAIAVGR